MQTIQAYKSNVHAPHSKDQKNKHLSQGTDLKQAALPLLLQLLLLLPSAEPAAPTGIRGGRGFAVLRKEYPNGM